VGPFTKSLVGNMYIHEGSLSVAVSDALDMIRLAYEKCAQCAESYGQTELAHTFRKMIIEVKAEPSKANSDKIVFNIPGYTKPVESE
jgi:hypothetical protein